ncbi:MAG: CHAT domain-containing protein [Myxococcota bacterium]
MTPGPRTLAVALATFSTIPPSPTPVVVEVPEEDRIEVEWSGCASELVGPVCRVRPGTELVVWVAPDQLDAVPDVALGDRRLAVEHRRVQGGRQLRVTLPDPLPAPLPPLHVADASRVRYQLPLAFEPDFPRLNEVREVRAAQGMEAALARAEAASDARGEEMAALMALRGRLLARSGRTARGVDVLLESAGMWDGLGVVSGATDDRLAAAYYSRLLPNGGRQRARRILGELDERARMDRLHPNGRARLPYFLGLTDLLLSDLRAASENFAAAERLAARQGLHRDEQNATLKVAHTVGAIGRSREAHALLLALESRVDAGSCLLVYSLWSRAWIELEAEAEHLNDGHWNPLTTLRRALDFNADACLRPEERLSIQVDLALAELSAGLIEDADVRLAAVRAELSRADLEVESWLWEVDGRLALARGDTDGARKAYDRLYALSQAHAANPGARRAAVGRARVAWSQGDLDAAVHHLRRAEKLLDRELLQVAVGEGRDVFASTRATSGRLLVEIHLERGRADLALGALRRERVRAIRSLHTRERSRTGPDPMDRAEAFDAYAAARAEVETFARRRFDTPQSELADHDATVARMDAEARRLLDHVVGRARVSDELPAYPPGDLLLAFARHRGAWTLIAGLGDRVEAVPLGPTVEQSLPLMRRALEARLAGVRRIVALPSGPWMAQDLHALPVAGRPLMAHVPVVYGLDVGPAEARRDTAGSALLVADPSSDLRLARGEAHGLAAAFGAAGLPSRTLVGPQATRRAVMDALGHAELLHFAGHSEAQGRSGWQRVLQLAGSDRLFPSDVLTLSAAPRVAILSGCGTARGTPGATVASLGLAQAFLLAGAELVVATSRPVSDAAAAALAAELGRRAQAQRVSETELRAAVLALRETHRGEWSAYRVLTR